LQKIQISERSISRGKVSWEQSQEDLVQAKTKLKTEPQISCLLSVQASINAISSILEANGHFQLPAFSCVEMLDQALQYHTELEEIRSQCYVLDSSLERDVMGNAQQKILSFTTPYARTCHQAGQTVLKSVKNYWKIGPDLSAKT
jgi:hypothetical protein|tara:strand:- start:3990 stop:4424 length:435 start_codon:yes stop_codon:yes gene_type:complete